MENKVINVKSNRQLLFDRKFIETSDNIKIVVNKPIKTWELNIVTNNSPHHRIGGYNSIIYDEGIYKMYYGETQYKEDGVYVYICYATSKDGINFKKPDLKLAKHFEGSNNIILGFGAGGIEKGLGDGGCMVFIDPLDKKNKYKLVARHALNRNLGLYSSNDGINFKFEMETIIDDERFKNNKGSETKIFHLDSQNIIFYDDKIKKYVAYVRRNLGHIVGQHRTIARGESKDLKGFGVVESMDIVLQSDSLDPMFYIDEFNINAPTIDFYTNATIKYKYAENAYFMFPSIYFKYNRFLKEFEKNKPMNAGPIDIRFASSRDGINWDRHTRESYIENGSKDEFDAYSNYMVHGIVPGNNNYMYMYYMGSDIIHGYNRGDQYEKRENKILEKANLQSKNNICAISRVKIRKDGFVSIKGNYKGGFFTTPLIKFEGTKLLVNIKTSAIGMLKIGILDEHNCFINGYDIKDCNIIHTTDDINKVVLWNNSSDLSKIKKQSIKLYFELIDCDIYAFEFVN